MKICLAQIDTTVGDYEGNAARVLDAASRARTAGSDIVLFPELTLTGYPPMDLLERSSFVESCGRCLSDVTSRMPALIAVIGFVEPSASGKPLHNAAAVVFESRCLGVHRKLLIPTYDVFDEGRYFEPGPDPKVIVAQGLRLGVTLCEDIWNDKAVRPRSSYTRDPVEILAEQAPDLLLNLSASPFEVGKPAVRRDLARHITSRFAIPVAYANLVGGNDGLVFDGNSFAMTARGRIIAHAAAFEPDLVFADLERDDTRPEIPDPPAEETLVSALCLGIRDFCGKLGIRRVAVGLSGGIDSAVVAALASKALGPESVIGVAMPSAYNSPESVRDARELAQALGIEFHVVPIPDMLASFSASLGPALGGPPSGLTEENLQARIRGTILMAVSNRTGALVLNTGNKSESAMGYCTLHGDMVGGLAVIGDLTKDEVYSVARALNRSRPVIPEYTITRPPSAELRPGQRDEDSLPPYPVLDPIVRGYVEDGKDAADLVAEGRDPAVVRKVISMISANEFKRRLAPPAIKVSAKAFGVGRRYPIAQRFREEIL
jgi:NAD+ synthetase